MFKRNRVELTGRISGPVTTKDAGDNTVTKARLIHNYQIGEREKMTAIDIEIWGKRGLAFEKLVTTKIPVFVEGILELDQWQDEGRLASRLKITVEDWQFLLPKADAAGESAPEPEAPPATKPKPPRVLRPGTRRA